jgi:beta-galactosidase
MRKEKWNRGWKVWKEDNAFRLIFSVPADAKDVDLPYDAVFHEAQKENSVNQGRTGFLDGGVYHYFKEYTPSLEKKGKTIRLQFDGSGGKTFVYVNGSLAGECNYPYQIFYVDISRYLNYGERNEILVIVDAMDLTSRYYVGGGLYRDVYLLEGDEVYIVPDSIHVTTLQIRNGNALIEFQAAIRNDQVCAEEIQCQIQVGSAEVFGQKESYPIRLSGQKETIFCKKLLIKNIEPWEETNPALYCLQLDLTDRTGKIWDTEQVETGFRTFSIDAENGLIVNGKKVKLRGGCIHHDQGFLGAETYDAYEYRRVRKMKEAGFNAIRCAHNPASRALLHACDQLGVYIMDEAFDMWARMKNPADYALFFEKGYREVLKSMVATDYNHPCVLLYSTGNEITDVATEHGYELSNDMTVYLHELDRTRYVTNGINGVFAAGNRLIQAFSDITGEEAPDALKGDINQCMSVVGRYMNEIVKHDAIGNLLERLDATMDVLGYNYMTGRYDMDCQRYPNRVIVGSETYPRQIAENWAAIKRNPAVIGDFTWTGYNYLGETGENWPDLINESGDIDTLGVRKPISFYREIVFGLRTQPYMAVRSPKQSTQPRPFGPWQLTDAESVWNFDGCEGETVTVEIYSDSEEVELYLNGESMGRKNQYSETDFLYLFDIPYKPGVLTVISYRNGEKIGEYTLETPGKATVLSVKTEKIERADEVLAFLEIDVLDDKGRSIGKPVENMHISLDDHAKLLAFGGRGQKHYNGYQNTEIFTENGKALAILKLLEGCESKVEVSVPGLVPTEIIL